MVKKFYPLIPGSAILFIIGLITFSCDVGIKNSPDPGVIRINLQSNPSDKSIVIVPDTLSVAPDDSFGVTIFQGKAIRDTISAILYKSPMSTQQEDIIYNIIKIESDEYKQFTIFESHLPPGNFNKIRFGMRAIVLKFSGFDEIKVESPDETALFVELEQAFEISANKTTEINVQISPFQSIKRYRDAYQFIPIVKIIDVKYY